MCIRDSVGDEFTEIVEDFFLAHRRFGAGRDVHHLRVGAKLCLLYTSDAADERSSVDLGGRRIIKKKK